MFEQLQSLILLAVWVLFGVLKVWAFVDCARRRPDAFPAVGRQTKTLWLILTGAAALTGLVYGLTLSILGIAGIVIALLYLYEIRPKIDQLTGGSRW